MATILEIREQIKGFYCKFEMYIAPVLRFLLAFLTLTLINRNIGFMYRLENPAIVLILSLLCSFLPLNFLIFVAAVFCMLHIYALSLECAVVVLAVFLLMFLLYFRFSPGDSIAVILTPLCFVLHVPYLMPLAMGLIGTPCSAISVGCGVVTYFVLDYLKVNSSVLANLEAESTVQKFKYVVDNLLSNKTMVVLVLAFGVTVILVNLIKRLSIDHSWTIAMVVGCVADVVIVMTGDMMMGLNIPVGGVILGSIIALALTFVLQFFIFSVDYTRTENLQFEDDEYYYYVKAVPKMTVAQSEKKVKHINPKKSQPQDRMNRGGTRPGPRPQAAPPAGPRYAERPSAGAGRIPVPQVAPDGTRVAPPRRRSQSYRPVAQESRYPSQGVELTDPYTGRKAPGQETTELSKETQNLPIDLDD